MNYELVRAVKGIRY